MSIGPQLSPEQRLELERMECVCRECHKDPITKRRRFYCASCGKPRAVRAGTTALSRPEALKKARDDERARCAAIAESYTDEFYLDPVQRIAQEIRQAILKG